MKRMRAVAAGLLCFASLGAHAQSFEQRIEEISRGVSGAALKSRKVPAAPSESAPRDVTEYEELYRLHNRIEAVVSDVESGQVRLLDAPDDSATALLKERLAGRSGFFAWRFVKIERNEFRKEPELSPRALYEMRMGALAGGGYTETAYTYLELKPALDFYRLTRPSELEGKVIVGSRGDPFDALNRLILQSRHGGSYTPPTRDALYKKAASELCDMRCPDFSDEEGSVVSAAFQEIYDDKRRGQGLGRELEHRMEEICGGGTRLEVADVGDFPVRYRGPANYYALVRRGRRQNFIFGPYAEPFECVETK